MRDFSILIPDEVGAFADVINKLAKANINIDGTCGFPCEGMGLIHILVKKADKTRDLFQSNNIQILDEQDVIAIEIEDRPGVLAEITKKLVDAEININLIYLATNTRLILGVDELEKARNLNYS